MKSNAVLKALQYLGVTAAFVVCGVLSARYCLVNNFPAPQTVAYLLGFPFALLCTILFVRTPRAILVIILMGLTWFVSAYTANMVETTSALGGEDGFYGFWGDLCSALVGGLVGGLGLTLSASIGCVRLISPRYLIAGGVIGLLAAWPIGISMSAVLRSNITPPSWMDNRLYYAFGIWQAAMGVYLYKISTNSKMKTQSVKIPVE